jgi:hypothetical protein
MRTTPGLIDHLRLRDDRDDIFSLVHVLLGVATRLE